MNDIINIGKPIDLRKLLDTRMLIQAGSGGGKSYLLRKLAESVGTMVQQIILDPEGEYVTLREKYPFALVAKNGDIPLNLKYAETLAHRLLETGMSAIIDLYELKSHERVMFVDRFLKALMNAPKNLWHSCLVYIDEAHIFCPESSSSESMASVIDLCTRGRKRGFAAILATQRLSKLHKDAAAECLNKMIGRTGLDIDRKRASQELGLTSLQESIALRDLQPGTFHGFGPAIGQAVCTFKVGKVETTHPQSGSRLVTIPPTPTAIRDIVAILKDIPEEAEKELQTKKQLTDEVARLTAALKAANRTQSNDSAKLREEWEKSKDQLAKLKQEGAENSKLYNALIKEATALRRSLYMVNDEIKLSLEKLELIEKIKNGIEFVKSENSSPPPPATRIVTINTGTNGKLGKCALAILRFLATYQDRGFTKVQVGIATGYSPNAGGFNNSLSELRKHSLIETNGERISVNHHVTYAEWVGSFEPQQYSVNTFRDKLGKCEQEIFDVLLDHPRERFTKENLATLTPSKYAYNAGGFNNSLSRLSTLEIIDRSNGMIQLNPELTELI